MAREASQDIESAGEKWTAEERGTGEQEDAEPEVEKERSGEGGEEKVPVAPPIELEEKEATPLYNGHVGPRYLFGLRPEERYWWENRWPVIDPSKGSRLIECWEITMILVLVYTCIMTPYDVALLWQDGVYHTWIWKADLVVCVFFFVDVVLQFFVAFPDPLLGGSRMIKRPLLIIASYVTKTFLTDLIACVPFDLIFVSLADVFANLTYEEATNAHYATIARLCRLLRLLRLQNLFVLIQRWQGFSGLSYSTLNLVKLTLVVIFTCHWAACVWCWVGFQPVLTPNWIYMVGVNKGSFTDPEYALCYDISSVWASDWPIFYYCSAYVYLMALHWAVMTTMTIGYGDIVATNNLEFWTASVLQLVLGLIFAYVLGEVSSTKQTLNPHELEFKRQMDDLNIFMEDQSLPEDMRRELRLFFHTGKAAKRDLKQLQILELMSPLLRGKVAMYVYAHWISRIWYMKDMSSEVYIAVAMMFGVQLLAPKEDMVSPSRKLFIIRSGVCVAGFKIKHTGDTWGEDMILENDHLRDTTNLHSLTHMDMLTLEHEKLMEAIMSCPETAAKKTLSILRWARTCTALRRAMKKFGAALREVEHIAGESTEKLPQFRLFQLLLMVSQGKDLTVQKNRDYIQSWFVVKRLAIVQDEEEALSSKSPRSRARRAGSMESIQRALTRSLSLSPSLSPSSALSHSPSFRGSEEGDRPTQTDDVTIELQSPTAMFIAAAAHTRRIAGDSVVQSARIKAKEELLSQFIDYQLEQLKKHIEESLAKRVQVLNRELSRGVSQELSHGVSREVSCFSTTGPRNGVS